MKIAGRLMEGIRNMRTDYRIRLMKSRITVGDNVRRKMSDHISANGLKHIVARELVKGSYDWLGSMPLIEIADIEFSVKPLEKRGGDANIHDEEVCITKARLMVGPKTSNHHEFSISLDASFIVPWDLSKDAPAGDQKS